MSIRMIGGKGKGGGNRVVSLVVDEMRSRCSAVDEADAAIEAFLRGDPMSEPARMRVVEALVTCEARIRAGSLVSPQERESGGEVSS